MNKKLVSVIIVHYGEKRLLIDCLKSIFNQSYKDIKVIIVNNADYIIDRSILKSMPGKIINNEDNMYYSSSFKQGIEISKGEFVLVLNNDVILDNDFVKECLKIMRLDSNIGMVSGKILDKKGKRIDSTGQFLSKYRRPTERGHKELDKGQFGKKGYIFGVCGVAGFYKKEMLEDIKLGKEYFDESYRMFYEDLDLNWRAQKLGWDAYYNPKAVAYHNRGSSSKKKKSKSNFYLPYLSDELKFYVIKNRYMTIIKNENLKDFIFNLFWILSYDLILWCFILFNAPKLIFRVLYNINFLKIAFRKRKFIEKGFFLP